MCSKIVRVTRLLARQCASNNIIKLILILTISIQHLKCNHIDRHHQTNQPTAPRNLLLQSQPLPTPNFEEPIGNHTVAVGRDAQLACKISNLGNYRTAWLRVEDKGILTIHDKIITRNYRLGLVISEDGNTFVLTIKNVQPSDKGGYMCQINSVPMKNAIGYLDVLTPPVFGDQDDSKSDPLLAATTTTIETPTDSQQQQDAPSGSSGSSGNTNALSGTRQASQVTVSQGGNATLTCKARGHPEPVITWRREDGQPIQLTATADDSNAVKQVESNSLSFPLVNRLHSGAYLCIASNGVQPSASKRQVLDVQFSPIVHLPQTEVLGSLGQPEVQLECYVELNPAGTYHWVKLAPSATTSTQPIKADANQQEADDLWLIEHDELMQSDKFDIVIKQVNSEKSHMMLNIRRLEKQDFGWYKCIARNSLGLQSSAIRLSESPSSLLVTSFRGSGLPPDAANGANSGYQRDLDNSGQLTNSRQRSRSSWIQRSTATGARSQQVASSAHPMQASIQSILLATLVTIVVSLLTL